MNRIALLILTLIMSFNALTFSQTLSDTLAEIEQAQYLDGNLRKLLAESVDYPKAAVEKDIEGDVVLFLLIGKDGTLDSMSVISSPDAILTTSSLFSFNEISDNWGPYKVNGNPIEKAYLCVFRYRMFMKTRPPYYEQRAKKFEKKQKYEKALIQYNNAIDDNPYDYQLFEARAELKEVLGDSEGAHKDRSVVKRIQSEIISVIDIYAVGI